MTEALYAIDSPAHAYEFLHIEDDADAFNNYLDDED